MDDHILVTGGSGFVGQHICRTAASMNLRVVSISRSGKPHGFKCNNESLITWVKADIFEAETWNKYLNECSAVIHCIAVLFQNPADNITHERFIYKSACIVGDEAFKSRVRKFVFISAAVIPVISPGSYNEAKRKAEVYLSGLNMHLAILRPSLLYGDEKPVIKLFSAGINLLAKIPGLKSRLAPMRALPVVSLAKAALVAAIDKTIQGILTVDDIERIAGINQ
jgi:nucleoside-diphosphate-sugar epimerase